MVVILTTIWGLNLFWFIPGKNLGLPLIWSSTRLLLAQDHTDRIRNRWTFIVPAVPQNCFKNCSGWKKCSNCEKIVLVTKRSFWDFQEQFIRVDQIRYIMKKLPDLTFLLNFSFTSWIIVVLKWLTITNEFLRGHTLFRTFESTVPVFIIRGTWDFQLNPDLIDYKISFQTFLWRLIYLGTRTTMKLTLPWRSIQETI